MEQEVVLKEQGEEAPTRVLYSMNPSFIIENCISLRATDRVRDLA